MFRKHLVIVLTAAALLAPVSSTAQQAPVPAPAPQPAHAAPAPGGVGPAMWLPVAALVVVIAAFAQHR
ncbi:hypothetical protein KO516_15940 [Citreicella sp. C3M06]|uniref:hypothetical protein n=1 Tax=Citreicella sp. C3M06 TaxID=2841564 RepID=UPI001C08EE7B|nr:hypothetical protein [Citreicella sp. C3M06]MBU2962280.1 hypothetical protein [Citreicella sp. C3M06]